jgi:hypothetical protein
MHDKMESMENEMPEMRKEMREMKNALPRNTNSNSPWNQVSAQVPSFVSVPFSASVSVF